MSKHRGRMVESASDNRILCALGTLAHNRSFTKSDVVSYLGAEGISAMSVSNALDRFRKKDWLRPVTSGRALRGLLYPTAAGWDAIEAACRR